MKIVGTLCFFAVVVGLLVNGAYMLISPQAWFRLPRWIRLTGALTQDQYGSGWGAIQVRLTGACCIAFVGLFVSAICRRF